MPTNVEDTIVITIDDIEVEMRPLKIKRLRKFMKEFDKINGKDIDDDTQIDVLMKCCVIAMDQYAPAYADQEKLENFLDISDVYRVVEAATGIRLSDSVGNQKAAASHGTS